MATITDALVRVEKSGQHLRADCFGNNAAIECPKCQGYPILIVARENQRGSSKKNAARCRHCACEVYIVDDLTQEKLSVVTIALMMNVD